MESVVAISKPFRVDHGDADEVSRFAVAEDVSLRGDEGVRRRAWLTYGQVEDSPAESLFGEGLGRGGVQLNPFDRLSGSADAWATGECHARLWVIKDSGTDGMPVQADTPRSQVERTRGGG